MADTVHDGITEKSTSDRDFDLTIFGATGFVGRLTAEHLARRMPATARVALAGRSAEKLERVRAELGPRAADWSIVLADATAAEQMGDLARRSRVVVTTVGPYARYGRELIRACAEQGTHYADLTGEVLFVREAVDTLHETAQRTGALIVNSCGFDSIPSDLGVLQLANRIAFDGEGEPTATTLVVTSLRGGLSGGTIDSIRNQVAAMASDPGDRATAGDPYALSPDREKEPDFGKEGDFGLIDAQQVSPTLRGRLAPFVMASYNTRIVRRSNALSNYRYGRSFRYREAMSVGNSRFSPVLAAAVAAGTGLAAAAFAVKPARGLLDRILPKAGTGPSESARLAGRFSVDIFTTTSTGAHYRSRVAAKGDPGYQATSVMLGESALALAFDHDLLPALEGGVLTPAVALGTTLIDRLREEGFTLSVDRLDDEPNSGHRGSQA